MNGILLIHKEKGYTSHDVVMKCRKLLHTKKIGHTGTLDPDATGVLVLLVNNACKALPFLEDTDKEYITSLTLGYTTDTLDIWGKITEEKEVTPIENFPKVCESFIGKQKQLPPMISSIKVNGKKLYEYARNNEEVERPLRDIEIYDIEVLDEKKMKFKVSCSSGTYIRSLCDDIAKSTGNLGCMSSLVRNKVGRFELKDCVTLKDVEEGNFKIFPLYDALAHLPMIEFEPITDIYNGKHVRIDTDKDRVVITHDKEVVAVYDRHHANVFKCSRGLW